MVSTVANAFCTARPTFTDVDKELLRNVLVQEAKYFQQTCSTVDGCGRPLEPNGDEGNSLIIKVASRLLRCGSKVKMRKY